jgi:flagellar hook-associated protein 3 FlgL
MRVTDTMRYADMAHSNRQASERLADASHKAAAGTAVVAPSDDPVAYAIGVRRQAALASLTSRVKVARESADQLSLAENALGSAATLLMTARTLAIQGSNETLGQSDRDALAQQVVGLRAELLDLANRKGTNGYVFGGTATDVAPFDAAGAFHGNDGAANVPVADSAPLRANVSGARAFTSSAGGRDVFADLDALAVALKSGSTSAIRSSIDTLAAGQAQVTGVQIDAGLMMERLESAADVMEQASGTVTAGIARAAGADDPASLYLKLTEASTAYEQSLGVTRTLLGLRTLASA